MIMEEPKLYSKSDVRRIIMDGLYFGIIEIDYYSNGEGLREVKGIDKAISNFDTKNSSIEDRLKAIEKENLTVKAFNDSAWGVYTKIGSDISDFPIIPTAYPSKLIAIEKAELIINNKTNQ